MASAPNSNPVVIQDTESANMAGSPESLYEIFPKGLQATRMRLQQLISPGNGKAVMRVILTIDLFPGQALRSEEVSDILRHCCEKNFEYAISSGGFRTIISELTDRNGQCVGDVVASFCPAMGHSGQNSLSSVEILPYGNAD